MECCEGELGGEGGEEERVVNGGMRSKWDALSRQ
jgi:hypothetical protein